MTKFLVRRIVLAAVIRCLPTSYVEGIARQRANLPGGKSYAQWLAQLNEVYGLDSNLFRGFMKWLGNALRGEFGESWMYNVPVTQKFSEVIWYSVVINVITLFLEIGICIPLGIAAARRPYGKTDALITVFALIGISLPTFFLATLLKFVFSIKLGWFDLYGIVGRYFDQLGTWGRIGDIAGHMVLPIVTLTMLSVGPLMRYTRTNMIEALSADYIRTARAKGLPEKTVVYKHAFRNTLLPLISYLSYLLPNLFAGSLITETLFQIPGIGYVAYNAMVGGDIPFTMFYLVFIILLTQVSLLAADILYAVADPRVRIR